MEYKKFNLIEGESRILVTRGWGELGRGMREGWSVGTELWIGAGSSGMLLLHRVTMDKKNVLCIQKVRRN